MWISNKGVGKKPKAVWPIPKANAEGHLLEGHWAEALVHASLQGQLWAALPPASLPRLQCTDFSSKHQKSFLEVRANPQPHLVLLKKMWILPVILYIFLCVGTTFCCRYGLCSIERMGFYYFLNNKISKPGKMCVLHNVHMKSCRHVLWLQHLLYALVPLLTWETNIYVHCYVRAV